MKLVSLAEYAAVLPAVAGIGATLFILLEFRHMEKHRNLKISMKLIRVERER